MLDFLLKDPKMAGLAILMGLIPSLFWLWFWLKEDKEGPEPTGLLTFCFIFGMVLVIITIPIQKFIQNLFSSNQTQIILWASVEELLKCLVVIILVTKTKYLNKPVGWPIFLITVALGFAALENILFLIKPLSLNQATIGLMSGQLRFLGSTLLHTVTSGIIGIALGLSFYMNKIKQNLYLFLGILIAIVLHSAFNFFIMNSNGSDFLKVFA